MEIDTSVDGLYELQSKLEQFKNSSNYMKLQIMAETEEFEMEIQNRCCELKEESEDEFQMLWLQYIKCMPRDITMAVYRVKSHSDIVNYFI